MSETFKTFFLFSDPMIRNVVMGITLLALCSAIVGCYTFLQKRALVGDVISHSLFPGVCLGFLLAGTKDPFIILLCSFATGWLSIVLVDWIVSKSKLSEDTALALVLSVFFAIGTVMISMIQRMDSLVNKSGLNHFLFGSAISISRTDVYTFGTVAIVLIILVIVFHKAFYLIIFDPNYAKSIGFPVRSLQLLLTSMTVFAVVIGIQAVGVVLMSAMLITPAAAARFWTQKLLYMFILAGIFGVFSGISGAYISYDTLSPTGPWVVMIMSCIAVFSFLMAPQQGILHRLYNQWQFKKKIRNENILKAIYQLNEPSGKMYSLLSYEDIQQKREFDHKEFKKGLASLQKEGYLLKTGDQFKFTSDGLNKGRQITKLHRLWEVYLTSHLNIAADHVHEDADSIEHIITPEVEQRLEKLLNYPAVDPHASDIPYKHQHNTDD